MFVNRESVFLGLKKKFFFSMGKRLKERELKLSSFIKWSIEIKPNVLFDIKLFTNYNLSYIVSTCLRRSPIFTNFHLE